MTKMKNPTLLKANVDREEALEIMDYLYCEHIDFTSEYKTETITWFCNDKPIAKWTDMYRNIMISKDFLDFCQNLLTNN